MNALRFTTAAAVTQMGNAPSTETVRQSSFAIQK
jgi:hypothetical protein